MLGACDADRAALEPLLLKMGTTVLHQRAGQRHASTTLAALLPAQLRGAALVLAGVAKV